MGIKVLTANRLIDGTCVWFAGEKQWLEDFQKAYFASDQEDIVLLESAALEALNNNIVVDANLIDLADIDGKQVPTRLRERIRIAGPTIAYSARFVEER
ncbi:DUF2849 domain-containing protein [Bartonella sp. LJL80]